MVAHAVLRVLARPGVLVVRKSNQPRPEYIGRGFDAEHEGKALDLEHPVTGVPEAVPYSARVRSAVQSGDLIAADADTARACGVSLPITTASGRAPKDKR
jgi:hypothetical protein